MTVLEDAQRLAKRRNLSLVKVDDVKGKTQQQVYKLVNNADIPEEDTKSVDKTEKSRKKDTKLFYITGKITEHDLQTKMKNTVRLLSKGRKVKIVITLDSADGVSSVILPCFSVADQRKQSN